MKPNMHFQDAAYWIAKAPPFPTPGCAQREGATVIIPFPLERARRGDARQPAGHGPQIG